MDFKIKSIDNLEISYRNIRLFSIVIVAFSLLAVITTVVMSYRFAEQQRQKIYVLDGGKSLMLALAQDVKANRPVEAREHIRRFHELFFTLAPESEAVRSNINRALELADDTAYDYYQDLSEQRYYNRLISTNTNQVYQLDSIVSDFDSYPYQVLTYGKQIIYRRNNVTERSLVAACDLINTVRSDNNPQGFLIEDFRVIQNEDIRNYERRKY
ncbi:conjugative transposon protein TraK [Porphyromonas levii]|uniref:conjugative transposon protein TraK n=1 Tax=Porphyromonas levii TaxID=28114 RepID=UPI000368F035|nr:conjugative transposon protein TraK [Porphyromonas levii]